MNNKYVWSKRFRVAAQTFGEIYYGLPKRTPEELVKAAKSPKSPIHTLFEWDNNSAAKEYRLIQARTMINSIQIEVKDSKNKPVHVAAFILSSNIGQHVPTLEATNEELTEAMQEMWSDMVRFRRKYRSMEVAQGVISAISHAEKRMSRMKKAA